MLTLGCENEAVRLTVAVGDDLVDLAAEVLRDRDSFASHIRHRSNDRGGIFVTQRVDVLLDYAPP